MMAAVQSTVRETRGKRPIFQEDEQRDPRRKADDGRVIAEPGSKQSDGDEIPRGCSRLRPRREARSTMPERIAVCRV